LWKAAKTARTGLDWGNGKAACVDVGSLGFICRALMMLRLKG
jgi:hypothetical protein